MEANDDNVVNREITSDSAHPICHSKSSSTSQDTAISDSASGMTLLWGIWELWCDTSAMQSTALSGVCIPSSKQIKTGHTTLRLKPDTWLDSVRSISLFDSAEGFWGLHRCTLLPSQLPHGVSYYIFRKNIAPMWEHEANRRGGKWVIHFAQDTPAALVAPTSNSSSQTDVMLSIDYAWLYLCLAVVGEQLPCKEEDICGVTVTCNKPSTLSGGAVAVGDKKPPRNKDGWKLCLWTRNADDAEVQMRIARAVHDLLSRTSEMGDTKQTKVAQEVMEKDRECAQINCQKGGMVDKASDVNRKVTSSECGASPAHLLTPTSSIALAGRKNSGHTAGASQRTMYYMVHREVMQAKDDQNTNKDSTPSGPWCKPRYVL